MGRTVVSNTVIDCEGCGKIVERSNLTAEPFPEGWFTLTFMYKTVPHQAEFCSTKCLVGWVSQSLDQKMRAQVFGDTGVAGVPVVPEGKAAK